MVKKRALSLIALLFLVLTFLFSAGAAAEEDVDYATMEDMISYYSHPDENGEWIDSLSDYDRSESWAIYIYMVGSDLESGNVNALSALTNLLINEDVENNKKEEKEKTVKRFKDFIADLDSIGMDLPSSFFLPESLNGYVYNPPSDGGDGLTPLSYSGLASDNLDQILNVPFSGNVKYIIQPGGAKAWRNININPNRRERFIIDRSGLRKLESGALENMADPETLASFLKFCTDNYDADHKMLIFWNHGAGPFGFGSDQIFEDILSLKDICDALAKVYGGKPNVKPFDIIGFDACLMGSVEVAKAISPFATYLVASEELEYAPSWDLGSIARSLAKRPNMRAEKLAKAIIDGFTEQFAKFAIEEDSLLVSTLSLVDTDKALKVYEAYSEFAKAVLRDSAKDLKILSAISREALGSIAFGVDSYDVFNLIDLKLFMENAYELYPDKALSVLEALDDAVLYSRGTMHGNYTGGLSVYYPLHLDNIGAVDFLLQYLDEIAESDAIKALYYYKLAGSLNKEHSAYLRTLGVRSASKLDSRLLSSLINSNIRINGSSIRIPIRAEQYSLLQNAKVNLQSINDDIAIDFGNIEADLEENAITLNFDGEWIIVNDSIILPLDEISSYDSVTNYRSPVFIDEEEYNLITSYDADSDTVYICGVSPSNIGDSDIVIAEVLRAVSSDMALAPIYTIYDTNSPGISNSRILGEEFTSDADIEFSLLSDGFYLLSISAFDFRGDEYLVPLISFTIEDGVFRGLAIERSMSTNLFN